MAASIACAAETPAPVTILRLRLVEGDGDVLATGSRTAHALVVRVTDESGKPVEGATVSFSLPAEGATGAFAGNMRTDIAISSGDGRAVMSGVQWSRTPGPISVRITVAKDHVRAGTVAALYLSETAATAPARRTKESSGWNWKRVAIVAGAASAAALAAGWKKGEQSAGAAAAAVQEPPGGAVTIGSPSIAVGKP